MFLLKELSHFMVYLLLILNGSLGKSLFFSSDHTHLVVWCMCGALFQTFQENKVVLEVCLDFDCAVKIAWSTSIFPLLHFMGNLRL